MASSDRPLSGAKQRPLSASASAPLPRPAPRAQTPDARVSRAGSTVSRARPQTALSRNRSLAGSQGPKSMFGSQVLGGRSSAPSFSFGSAPARIPLSGGSQRRTELQPSVATSSQKTPGPIYNPKPTTKWIGDGPCHPFGTETQRPPAMTNGEVSKSTGQSMSPGPGTYALQGAFGPQYLGRCRNLPHYSFGFQKQHTASARNTCDPGPVYDVPQAATRRGNMVRATYSFGREPQRGQALRSERVPGPGHYRMPVALGPQVASVHKSGMIVGFGVPSASGGVGRPMSLEGRHSPGPKYSHDSSHGKQNLSGRRTQPVMRFPKGQRFSTSDLAGANTPGPGHYVV